MRNNLLKLEFKLPGIDYEINGLELLNSIPQLKGKVLEYEKIGVCSTGDTFITNPITVYGDIIEMEAIIGMAGKSKGLESGKARAQFINRIYARRVMSTGLTSFSGSELPEMIARGEFVEASEKEKLEEMLIFFETLTANIFFEGTHYLNSLRYRFQTSNIKNKKNVIEKIKNHLNNSHLNKSCS